MLAVKFVGQSELGNNITISHIQLGGARLAFPPYPEQCGSQSCFINNLSSQPEKKMLEQDRARIFKKACGKKGTCQYFISCILWNSYFLLSSNKFSSIPCEIIVPTSLFTHSLSPFLNYLTLEMTQGISTQPSLLLLSHCLKGQHPVSFLQGFFWSSTVFPPKEFQAWIFLVPPYFVFNTKTLSETHSRMTTF